MSSTIFYDVTLRDGSHANRHSFNTEFCDSYIDLAYAAGIRHIELGHGNGLGGSSLHIGKLKEPDIYQIIGEKKRQYNDLNFGVHVIPGLATFDDIEVASDMGVSIFRVASHCTEADTTETYIDYALKKGHSAWGLLMMSHMVKADQLAREAKKMESYGAERIVFLDSAGALTPKMVKKITNEISNTVEIPVGFHAHNNLHAAIANSLAAIDAGCSTIDGCARGYGAGAGNLCMEALVALLEKDGISTGLDFPNLSKLAEFVELNYHESLPTVDCISTATGFYGVFSGFKPKIMEAAKKFQVSPMEIISRLGQEQVIAGQEDQIIATAAELSNRNIL